MLHFNLFRARRTSDVPRSRIPSPEENASFISQLLFAWLGPLLTTGYKRPLEYEDIWLVPQARSASYLAQSVIKSFENLAIDKQHHRSQRRWGLPVLAWALHRCFKFDFWVGGLCQLVESILQAMAPFTLRFLIIFARDAHSFIRGEQDSQPPLGRGVGLVLAITAMQVIQSFSSSHFHYRSTLFGGESRSALIAVAFSKSLRLSRRARAGGELGMTEATIVPTGQPHDQLRWQASKEGWSNSRVMGLISTDVSRIEQSCTTFHLVWTSPIAILLTITLLIINLGYSALAGVAVLVLGLTTLTKVVKVLARLRAAVTMVTDQRAGLTQEILHGIRFVKYFGWESAFLRRLQGIRASETSSLQILHITKSAIGAASMALPIFSSMAAFLVYSSTNSGPLDPALIFSSLALFNSLRTPMNWLPTSIGHLVDADAALKRFEALLLSEESPAHPGATPGLNHAIQIQNATFTWEKSSTLCEEQATETAAKSRKTRQLRTLGRYPLKEADNACTPRYDGEKVTGQSYELPFFLKDISFTISSQELVAVVGSVGCGKSSLLSALANDMRLVQGTMKFNSNVAYCPQSAWLQNATIRENILFGRDFEKELYSRVTHACALEADFALLPRGDLTEIGEKGITLSGGQKQRVNIARAIYSNAGIVLLDDPLSAVDAHVGNHIFNQAISGLLHGKCRVLVTHQLQVLHRCDRVIWMTNGRIEAVDKYESLLESSVSFRRFVQTSRVVSSNESQVNDEMEDSTCAYKECAALLNDSVSDDNKKLMQEDVKAVNSVPWTVYHVWMKSSGSILNMAAVLILMCIFRAANLLTSLSLAWWVSDAYGLSRASYIGLYAGLGVAQAVLLFAFSMVVCIVGTRASQTMSNDAMWQILRAPIVFFDTTPLGRIIHRFTKDVDTMDNSLTDSFRQYLIVLSSLLGSFGFIIAYFHYVSRVGVQYFARELKRYHAILDGVVFAKFNEALVGASTIRAYGREEHYVSDIYRAIDDMGGAYFLTFANQRWLSLRLDNLGNILSFTTGMLAVTTTLVVSPSITGLILSYSLSLVGIIQITVRYFADVDNSMSSTERLHQYTSSLAHEASLEEDASLRLRSSWPESGEIVFESVQMRYRPELPLVLDKFTLTIRGGERIGIVGRTGAGKSTILSTLFRLTELSGGRIMVDGVDIAQVGLHNLRSRLAIIPQDPTLFRGTIRSNLDPFDRHSDLEMWNALRQAHLLPREDSSEATGLASGLTAETFDATDHSLRDIQTTAHPPENNKETRITLDAIVEEEGLNYSLGQRQLLALARAHLRNARITLIDEGTSSVDSATDVLVQKTIAQELSSGKTLIAIAHRLRTVLLYDRVCVMDQGRIVELGPPLELWEQAGVFRGMCDRSGITREDFSIG
ncbi:canalicular multispecific organic anion transporter 1 [Verticillium alfalfae VaMs.102]|uniref:Canalicular multispecific organic anion transporter 1 n=1 Tax=Verticillium alfalfae (strain VaMs.102 / ATCC MYA-4576 / FGSC 10136) TaxID=526221 RepID=C9SRP6_VERA1|nr:canalicular multispecific organic anion transporter 1 [Verticillium alfalfae VaMs.102]EEY21461.1 canalicular multispecific organic anion transporter 1 [Verticillium alfalfae VaMs.102]